ncbi:MAG: hypothetical protein HY438_03160 [DPANN group archaeon]|nr:hypothetical protein [DPANN group archaeon]
MAAIKCPHCQQEISEEELARQQLQSKNDVMKKLFSAVIAGKNDAVKDLAKEIKMRPNGEAMDSK